MNKKITSTIIYLLLAVSSYSHITSAESAPDTDRLIITFEESVAESDLPITDQIDSDTAVVEIPENESPEAFIKDLEQDPSIAAVEPDLLLELTTTPNDRLFSYQWHHTVIQTTEAWKRTAGDRAIKVAVIDNGIDLNQPDLAGQFTAPYDAVTGQTTNPPGSHGTHVAGIIGSAWNNNVGGTGVAPSTSIIPVNVFAGESAYLSDLIKGIDYAIAQDADIINLSLGTSSRSNMLNDAIQRAHASGAIIIAAAGNNASSNPYFPASFDNVIAVSATNENDQLSSFSNTGAGIDIAAPGSNIVSTLPNNQYGTKSGTSMAAPVVSGVTALIWANNPNWTNEQVTTHLLKSTDDLGATGRDDQYGNGRVNAKKALGIIDIPAPTASPVSDRDTTIKGNATGTTITITNSQNQPFKGTITNGKYQITIPKQQAGTTLTIQSQDAQKNTSPAIQLTVTDKTPPPAPALNQPADNQTTITGKAEPNSTISLFINKQTYTATTNEQGNFTITIPAQKAGTVLQAQATDKAGNKSNITKTTTIDKTPPPAPTINQVTDQAKTITGKAEPNTTVTATIQNKNYTTKTPGNGNFTIKIPAQKAGTSITLNAQDNAKNKSSNTTTTVTDKTPPAQPTVSTIKTTTTSVKGKTEPNATITITANKKTIGTAKADKNGNFTIKIKKQKANTPVIVTAADKAKNKSNTPTIKVKK